MKRLNWTVIALALAAPLAIGCGGSDSGSSAYLSIVGDTNVSIDNGESRMIRVRYHDADGDPLAGQIDFRMMGTTGGSTIGKSSAMTTADGVVEVELIGGADGTATFKVEASANDAAPALWAVEVGVGAADLDPTGQYELDSRLDIISGLDNDFGKINVFLDMTDDEHDPATWIIDKGLEELDLGWVTSAVGLLRGIIDPAVNDLILTEDVEKIVDVGRIIGEITRDFGTTSILEVKPTQADIDGVTGHAATHTITGFNFTIEGEKSSYDTEELSIDDVPATAEQIIITKDSQNRLIISKHEMALSYGAMIVVALQKGVIPLFDDQADSLQEFLANRIDCEAFGVEMNDKVGFGGADTFELLCDLGVTAMANEILDQLKDIDDTGVRFEITGAARPRDRNGDRKPDELNAGQWSGFIHYGSSEAEMDPEVNTFTGQRITSGTN